MLSRSVCIYACESARKPQPSRIVCVYLVQRQHDTQGFPQIASTKNNAHLRNGYITLTQIKLNEFCKPCFNNFWQRISNLNRFQINVVPCSDVHSMWAIITGGGSGKCDKTVIEVYRFMRQTKHGTGMHRDCWIYCEGGGCTIGLDGLCSDSILGN